MRSQKVSIDTIRFLTKCVTYTSGLMSQLLWSSKFPLWSFDLPFRAYVVKDRDHYDNEHRLGIEGPPPLALETTRASNDRDADGVIPK